MKRVLYQFFAVTVLSVLLFSCKMEEPAKQQFKEGVPTQVTLKYNVDLNKVITRAEQESQYEYRVSNLYVFIFKSDGSVYFQRFFEEGTGLTVNNGTYSSSGSVSFDTRTIADVKIVGIANLTTGTVATAYTVTPDQMNAIKTFDELEAFVMKMNSNTVYRGGMFMLTGTAVDSKGSESIDITGSESGTSTIDCSIKLKRTDAKVKFNVTVEPSNPAWQNFSFQPKEWIVKKVPSQSYVLPHTEANADGNFDADGEYFDTPLINFEEVTRSEAGLYNGGSFVFYMPENKKAPKETITEAAGDYNAQYALRDESDHNSVSGTGKPGQEYENGAFTYANENSTYVEMTGTLTYLDADGRNVNADVRYIVHLGGVGGVNDYNTERNVYYIYNVKVKGINDIIVEVTNASGTDEELRPGHEGDVVYSNASVYELDSHYDRILININKSQIADDMTWGIRTPFSSGIYQNDNNFTGLEDYKWIKFAINKDYGIAADRYVKYPGDQNYAAGDNVSSPSYPAYAEARLMDIQQLIERLKAEKNNPSFFDGNGNVAITVFVDENLYFNNPVTGEPGEQNRSLWKASVDKEDRMLHIIATGSKYSPDGNSSIVNSLFTFKQKAIRTIFNTDKESLTTAWGLESVMETKRLAPGDVSRGKDRRNGRVNMIEWAVGQNWTKVLSVQDRYALGNGYENAAYACMLRNRDLNGNDVIDQNEVRWYLAAIDQLVDIYLGEYALDEASRLYPRDEADRGGSNNDMVNDHVRWHYTSSSYKSDDGGPWVLWAEEGAGLGSYGDSYDFMDGTYAYRCIRNLGLSLDKPDEEPEVLVKVNKQSDGTYMVDMSNMSVKSRRTNYELVQLPEHNERDADNRPYAKFQVLDAESDALTPNPSAYLDWGKWKMSWGNAHAWQYYQTNDVCPPGYRIPNQRELLIMSSRLPEDAWKTYVGKGPAGNERTWSKAMYLCQTAFSMDGKYPYDSNRDGFYYNAQNKKFVLQNDQGEVGYVRCVRDVQ